MRGNLTLTEAIAIAGGFTEMSKHSRSPIGIAAPMTSGPFAKNFSNLKEMEQKGDLHEDPLLHPGDMLFVPKNALSKIKPFLPYTGVGAKRRDSPSVVFVFCNSPLDRQTHRR